MSAALDGVCHLLLSGVCQWLWTQVSEKTWRGPADLRRAGPQGLKSPSWEQSNCRSSCAYAPVSECRLKSLLSEPLTQALVSSLRLLVSGDCLPHFTHIPECCQGVAALSWRALLPDKALGLLLFCAETPVSAPHIDPHAPEKPTLTSCRRNQAAWEATAGPAPTPTCTPGHPRAVPCSFMPIPIPWLG